MKREYLNDLKHEVEKTFGKKIMASADCRDLSMEISQWSGSKISFSSMKRLFNLMKEEQSPSSFTLNALSNYCGYSSFDEFIAIQKNQSIKSGSENSFLEYLVMLFSNIEVNSHNDVTYLNLVQHTVQHLERHTGIAEIFQREIAKTKNGQIFYFEKCVNIDMLNSFYGEGLYYYLHQKKTKEANIFGHSLLCFRSWLSMNDAGLENQYNNLKSITPDFTIPPNVLARYFASLMYTQNFNGRNAPTIILDIRKYYSSLPQLKETTNNSFELIITECLILTGFYEEALFYIGEVLNKLKSYLYIPSGIIDISLFETISLYKAIALAHCGQRSLAAEILKSINPQKFSFLSKKYLTILYISLKNTLTFSSVETEQVLALIKETGFTRLSYLFLIPAGASNLLTSDVN